MQAIHSNVQLFKLTKQSIYLTGRHDRIAGSVGCSHVVEVNVAFATPLSGINGLTEELAIMNPALKQVFPMSSQWAIVFTLPRLMVYLLHTSSLPHWCTLPYLSSFAALHPPLLIPRCFRFPLHLQACSTIHALVWSNGRPCGVPLGCVLTGSGGGSLGFRGSRRQILFTGAPLQGISHMARTPRARR